MYINRQWLTKAYKTGSINDIARECNVAPSTIRKYLRKFGIKIRSVSEATKLKYDTDQSYRAKKIIESQSQEHRQKIINAAKLSKPKRIEISKTLWQDIDYRANSTKRSRKLAANQDFCKKISEAVKRKWCDQEYKQKMIAVAATNHIKISQAIRKLWEDPIYRDHHSTINASNWQSTSYRQKVLDGMSSDTAKAAMSAAAKKHWAEHRDEMVAIIRGSLAEPITLEKLSAAALKNWANNDYRTKVVAATIIACNTDDHKQKLSDSAHHLWNDQKYRDNLLNIIRDRTANPEWCSKLSQAISKLWQNPKYRTTISATIKEKWTDPEYRAKVIEASKLVWDDQAYRKRMALVRTNCPRISAIQIQLYKYLDDLGVKYYKEGPETVVDWYTFDCLIPATTNNKKNILIECQGDYWHSLEKAKRTDKAKFTYIDRYYPDCEIMYIWEHEFFAKNRVLDRLKLKLNVDIEVVDFNFKDVVIGDVGVKDVRSFLDSYHYLGKDRGGRCFGAFYNNNLIGCIVYSTPLRQNTAGALALDSSDLLELSRMCIHPSYHKKNFSSWFIAKTITRIHTNIKVIIAYADTTVGHNGTVYKAAGFKMDHTVPADYWYISQNNYVMHKRTLYGRAVKMKMTEAEFAEKNLYIKKYGGEKLCYIKYR